MEQTMAKEEYVWPHVFYRGRDDMDTMATISEPPHHLCCDPPSTSVNNYITVFHECNGVHSLGLIQLKRMTRLVLVQWVVRVIQS